MLALLVFLIWSTCALVFRFLLKGGGCLEVSRQGSLYPCPGTHPVEQGATKSQKPTSAPQSVGIKGVYHYHWAFKFLSLGEEIEVTSIHNNAGRHLGLVISPPPLHEGCVLKQPVQSF